MTPALDTEKQLRDLRVGLKLIACLISPLLTLQLFVAATKLVHAREMYADMGSVELPGLFNLLSSHPLIVQSLPLLSLASFIALLIVCFRSRTALFLYLFSFSLFLHLLLIWLFDFAAGLPLYKIIQNMQNF
ncbi:MAG: hypothetical protein O3A87_00650 [Verrucomicrobia bacterium]|nr:hypothetical protein [Verrucomicrobiota bacterium]MDA1004978.1 hypothetical protein [Verrucomicrobiota bacterium]